MHLSTSASGPFASDGAGSTIVVLSLGPQRYSEAWTVQRISISTSSAVASGCKVYRNTISPSAFVDGTSKANQNVSDNEIALQSLDKLIFVFTGGTVGSYATVVLDGEQEYGN